MALVAGYPISGRTHNVSSMRTTLKRLLRLSSTLVVAPLVGFHRLSLRVTESEAAMQGPSQLVSLIPGQPGHFLRAAFYRLTLRRCEGECSIGFGTIFSTPQCEIGRNVYIGAFCVLSDSVIGDDVLIGSHVQIVSGKHAHGFDQSGVPMRLQPTSRTEIRIGANTWIGNGAIVMADVGEGCVVGAGSVVVKPVESNSIVAGNPARLLRNRLAAPRG